MGGVLGTLETDRIGGPVVETLDAEAKDVFSQHSMLQSISVYAGKTGVEGPAVDDTKTPVRLEDCLFRFPVGCCFYPIPAAAAHTVKTSLASRILSKFSKDRQEAHTETTRVFNQGACLIVSDTHNGVVRCITPGGNVWNLTEKRPENSTGVLGIETTTFYQPGPCVYDPFDHSLLVPDTSEHIIRRIRLEFDSEGEPRNCSVENLYEKLESMTKSDENKILMTNPWGIAFDHANPGYLYVSDSLNHCIRRYHFKTRKYELIAGTSKQDGYRDGADAWFHSPRGILVVGDKLWICDNKNSCIRVLDLKTKITTTISGNPNTMNSRSELEEGKKFGELTWRGPRFLEMDNFGRMVIVDSGCGFIRVLTPPSGVSLATCEDLNEISVQTVGVGGMDYNTLLYAFPDAEKAKIPSQTLFNPGAIAVDIWNNFYIADQSAHRIVKYQYGLEVKESRLSILLGSKDANSRVYNFINSTSFDAHTISLIFTFCGRQ